jgi:proteasome lid subunit RPN8/RPN11
VQGFSRADAGVFTGRHALDPIAIGICTEALKAIGTHAREAWPYECCGLLLGTPATIAAAYRARNADQSPIRYLVCPEDHFAAIRFARSQGLEVVGAYHSHPAGRPHPSATDRDEAHGDGFTYVIAGTRRLRRSSWHPVRRRPGRTGSMRRARRERIGRFTRSVETQGHWLAAWRLLGGNFVAVPLVRVP